MASLQSDITIDASKFDPNAIPESVAKFNAFIIEKGYTNPKWTEVGAPRYREMRMNGETAFPAPTFLPQGFTFEIPSREPGRSLPCRLFHPSKAAMATAAGISAEPAPKSAGITMHIHGGGWVLMDHNSSDPLLQNYADMSGCVAISVGYRLAPEHPFPAGPEDCYDAANWLIENGEKEFGGKLRFIGGENQSTGVRSRLLPRKVCGDLKSPSISPIYEDVEKWRGKLPPALFTCGTVDPLRDDSVNMAVKWLSAGTPAGVEGVVLKLYPGAAHGFLAYPVESYEPAGWAWKDIDAWIKARVGT